MADDLDQNKLRTVIDVIDNTVVLGSDSPTFTPAKFFASGGTRIFLKPGQRLENTFPIVSGNGIKRLAGALFDLNPVAQVVGLEYRFKMVSRDSVGSSLALAAS